MSLLQCENCHPDGGKTHYAPPNSQPQQNEDQYAFCHKRNRFWHLAERHPGQLLKMALAHINTAAPCTQGLSEERVLMAPSFLSPTRNDGEWMLNGTLCSSGINGPGSTQKHVSGGTYLQVTSLQLRFCHTLFCFKSLRVANCGFSWILTSWPQEKPVTLSI